MVSSSVYGFEQTLDQIDAVLRGFGYPYIMERRRSAASSVHSMSYVLPNPISGACRQYSALYRLPDTAEFPTSWEKKVRPPGLYYPVRGWALVWFSMPVLFLTGLKKSDQKNYLCDLCALELSLHRGIAGETNRLEFPDKIRNNVCSCIFQQLW